MNLRVSTEACPKLSDSQRTALISLLADEDSRVHQEVHRKLISFGPIVIEWLKPYRLDRKRSCRERV